MGLIWRNIQPRLLEPQFVQDLTDVLGSDPSDWYVTYGHRTLEEQASLWAKYQDGGPKAAPPGKSAHNFGLAVDIVLDGDPHQPRLQMDWNERHPDWIRMRAKIDAHPRLHGGWWFGDGDHIEKTKWKDHKDWHMGPLA